MIPDPPRRRDLGKDLPRRRDPDKACLQMSPGHDNTQAPPRGVPSYCTAVRARFTHPTPISFEALKNAPYTPAAAPQWSQPPPRFCSSCRRPRCHCFRPPLCGHAFCGCCCGAPDPFCRMCHLQFATHGGNIVDNQTGQKGAGSWDCRSPNLCLGRAALRRGGRRKGGAGQVLCARTKCCEEGARRWVRVRADWG